jgi:glutaredoxin
MKQRCPMIFIYFSWLVFLVGLVFLLVLQGILIMIVWLLWFPLVMWMYIKFFPRLSRYLGYGSVQDEMGEPMGKSVEKVTLYTALGCPFCPLVERRLLALQKELGFTLEKIDVTAKPGLLMKKKIQAVPVVEIGDHVLVGHATTKQLREMIASA